MRLTTHFAAAGLMLLCAACAWAQGATAPVGVGNTEGANAVTRAAVQQGALNCASRINQVSNFLGFNSEAGATLLIPPSQ